MKKKNRQPLSARETEVLYYIAHGWTAPQIGKKLGITWRTVGTHVKTIMRKRRIRSRAGLAIEWLRLSGRKSIPPRKDFR